MEKTVAISSSDAEPDAIVGSTDAATEMEQFQRISEALREEIKNKEAVIRSQQAYISASQNKISELSEQVNLWKSRYLEMKVSIKNVNRRNNIDYLEAQRVRNTLAFQLGYAMIHGFKSWTAVVNLPKALLAIRRETVHRRKAKLEGQKPKSAETKPVSDSEWCHPFVKLQGERASVSKGALFMIGRPMSGLDTSVESITPQNFEFRLLHVSGATVKVFVNRYLLESPWGNLFDFNEMQNFKRFLILQQYINKRGGRIELFIEENISIPLLSYVENEA